MPSRWAIWLAVEGDLKFASHHEMMRVLQRVACRGSIPVRYTQGFNPHPRLSLTCPRSVGVASECDVLVLGLTDSSQAVEASDLVDRLNRQAPVGLRCLSVQEISPSQDLRPRRVTYEMPLADDVVDVVAQRLETLAGQETWITYRQLPPKGPRQKARQREMDLKRLVEEPRLEGRTLVLDFVPDEAGRFAKPSEVLELLGLDPLGAMGCLIRTRLDIGLNPPCCAEAAPGES